MSGLVEKGGAAPRIAVALAYDGEGAPRVTAKGFGEIADTIMATARAHDIAHEANPLLAAALSQVELDAEIPVELYQAVAQVIGFVLALQRTASGSST